MKRILGAVVAAVAVLSACEAGTTSGPLEPSDAEDIQCVTNSLDHRLTFGIEATTNTTRLPLVVDGVSLQHPRHMRVIGARVSYVPTRGPSTLVGTWDGWPPQLGRGNHEVRGVWRSSQPIPGAKIAPGDAMTVSFTIGVEAENGARSGPIRVKYHDMVGNSYTWKGGVALRVARGKSCPG